MQRHTSSRDSGRSWRVCWETVIPIEIPSWRHTDWSMGQIFANHWNNIPTYYLESRLRDILPTNVERSVAYDVKKNPEKYLNATLKMWRDMERVKEDAFSSHKNQQLTSLVIAIAWIFVPREKVSKVENRHSTERITMTGSGRRWWIGGCSERW